MAEAKRGTASGRAEQIRRGDPFGERIPVHPRLHVLVERDHDDPFSPARLAAWLGQEQHP